MFAIIQEDTSNKPLQLSKKPRLTYNGAEDVTIIWMLENSKTSEEVLNSLNATQQSLQYAVRTITNKCSFSKLIPVFNITIPQDDDKVTVLRKLIELYHLEKATHVRTKISCVLAEFVTLQKFDIQVKLYLFKMFTFFLLR